MFRNFCCCYPRSHGLSYRMKLMVTRNLLDQMIPILLEQDEMPDIIQKQLSVEEPFNHRLHLKLQFGSVIFVVNNPPGVGAVAIRGYRTNPGGIAVTYNISDVIGKQIGNLLFIRLHLSNCLPDVRIFVIGVFEFAHRKRNAIDEDQQIGPARLFATLNGELTHNQKLILVHGVKIYETNRLYIPFTVSVYLNRDPVN